MADFEQSVSLSIEIPSRELGSAREQIEDSLSDVPVSFDAGPAERAVGDGGGQTAGGATGRRMRQWARQRTETLDDIHQLLVNIGEQIGGGGGVGGGGGGLGSAIPSMGGLTSVVGGASLLSLVTKVPLRALLTRAPAFATLVTAADLGNELVKGELTTEDLVNAPIELGDQITFGLIDNKAIEGAIGTVTLAIGTYQIGSIVAGQLSGTALASYFGTVSMSSLVTGSISSSALAGTYLGTIGIGTLLTGLGAGALAGLLGSVALSEIVTGGSFTLDLSGGEDAPGVYEFGRQTGTATTGVTGQGLSVSDLNRMRNQQMEGPTAGWSQWNRSRRRQWMQANPRAAQDWVNENPVQAQNQAMRGMQTEVNVDLNADTTVETSRDEQEIVDAAVREVEEVVLPEFRREMERALGSGTGLR